MSYVWKWSGLFANWVYLILWDSLFIQSVINNCWLCARHWSLCMKVFISFDYQKADFLCLPFSIVWIESVDLLKTLMYLLCDYLVIESKIVDQYNSGYIPHGLFSQKTLSYKINFMVIGVIYVRYTELNTLLVTACDSSTTLGNKCCYHLHFLWGTWPWKVRQLVQGHTASLVEAG